LDWEIPMHWRPHKLRRLGHWLTLSLVALMSLAFWGRAETLVNLDFGGGDATSEVGPAATGHTASDFWNYYTRNDGQGHWTYFGALSNLQDAEGAATGAGLTVANAPGAWGL